MYLRLNNIQTSLTFLSTKTTDASSKHNTALIKQEQMEPAPPITQTFLPLISSASFSLFASISGTNMLTGRRGTLSEINLSKLNFILQYWEYH